VAPESCPAAARGAPGEVVGPRGGPVLPSPRAVEKTLLINADDSEEVRVVLLEDGRLEEVYVEAGTDPTGKGNVFVGRVQNVERGIGAAFVDLGGGVTGFLHASDIDLSARPEGMSPRPDGAARPEAAEPEGRKITDLVKPGDPLLVQVTRGPVGHKGPALTTRISLPGRYVVLLVNGQRSGVSRRIDSGEERDRMRNLLGDLEVPRGMALILRTASNGRTREEVQADLVSLYRRWEELKGRLLEGGGPRLVHEESDLVSRAMRDILPADCSRIVTDDAATADRIREFLARTQPPAPPPEPDPVPSLEADAVAGGADPTEAAVACTADAPAPTVDGAAAPSPVRARRSPPPAMRPPPTVELHAAPTPLFHAFGIEAQIEDAFRRSVRLPSGGSIVIDPTEALVAIDVNSGRLTEEEDLESTALKTDLEAVPEIARQLRMRDLGGVIVIDFIDLAESSHVQQVEQALREALKRDRARIRLGRMGPFGCLELTRQRIRPALSSVTHVACPTCAGLGKRRHPLGLALRVLREIQARVARSRGHGGMEVRVAPPVADVLKRRKGPALSLLEAALTGPLRLVADAQIPYGGWSIKGIPLKPSAPGRGGAGGSPATSGAPADGSRGGAVPEAGPETA